MVKWVNGVLVGVDSGSLYRRTYSPCLAWYWLGGPLAPFYIKWTGWTLAIALPWWQHHKHCFGIVIIIIIIIKDKVTQKTLKNKRSSVYVEPVCLHHSLANRHSFSTSAETRDRKCFIMQLILVVGKADMINQICQMLSFCWKLLSAYFAEKKWLPSTITKYSSNCKVCMY